MLYFIILIAFFFILFLIWFNKRSVSIRKKQQRNVSINFEDIDSLNVSKIVIEENDIDYIRNEFWYQYKQKQVLNSVSFYNLKRIFEQTHQKTINEFVSQQAIDLAHNEDTFTLVQQITSDDYAVETQAKAFYLLEEELKA